MRTLKPRLKVLAVPLLILILFAVVSLIPKTETITVETKIQKKNWFRIPLIAENVLTLIVSTDKGYFYVKGEFDSDGIRHIFNEMESGKTYRISYHGLRFEPFYMYPLINGMREIT